MQPNQKEADLKATEAELERLSMRDYITRGELATVRLGMSPREVKSRIGSSMLGDKNELSRWDYLVKHGEGASEEFVRWGVAEAEPNLAEAAPVSVPESVPIAAVVMPDPPAAEPIPSESDLDQAGAISDTLSNWASAWSSKNASAYLGFYATTFEHGKKSRKVWEAQRRERLGDRARIQVNLRDVMVNMTSAHSASASFKQEYVSDRYRDVGNKMLILVKVDGQWKIQKEEFVK
jgi:hypothetical protein